MCEDIDAIVDDVAGGTRVLSEVEAAHIASCSRCASSIAMARAMETALSAAPPPTPASLTASVLRAVRRERWRAELFVDRAFNIALAGGGALIALAVWMMMRAGSISAFVAERFAGLGAASFTIPDPGPHAWAYVLSVLLLVSAAASWYWIEGER